MTRPRQSRRRRWLIGALVLLSVAASATLFVVQSPWFGRWVADAAEELLGDELGERVLIGGLRIAPLQRAVTAEGVIISKADGPERGATILAVEQVRVVVGLEDGQLVARQLSLVRPTVRLHIDEDGLREFRGLAGADEPMTRFPWDRLWVVDATLQVEGPSWKAGTTGLAISPTGDPSVVYLEPGAPTVELGGVARAFAPLAPLRLGWSPWQVVLPPARLDAGDLVLEGKGRWHASKGVEALVSVRADPSFPNDLAAGSVRVEGSVHADLEVLQNSEGLSLEGLVWWPEAAMHVGVGLARRIDLGDVQGPLSWNGRSLTTSGLRLDWAGGTVVARGQLDPVTTGLQVVVLGEDIALGSALAATGVSSDAWVDFVGDIELQTAGTLSPFLVAGSHDIALRQVWVGDGPRSDPSSETLLQLRRAQADGPFMATTKGVNFGLRTVRTPRSRGKLEAELPFGEGETARLSFDMRAIDLSELRPLADMELEGRGRMWGTLRGPLGSLVLDANATLEDFGIFGLPIADELSGPISSPDLRSLRLPDARARLGQSTYGGHVFIDFRSEEGSELDLAVVLQEGRLQDFTGLFFELPEIDAQVEGELSLAGAPRQLDGEIELRLSDVDVFGEGFDRGAALAAMDGGRFTLDHLTLDRDRDDATVLMRGTVGAGWKTSMELVAAGHRLESLDTLADVKLPIRGAVSLDAQVGGTLFDPEPEGRIAVRETWLGRRSLDDSTLRFDTEAGRLSWRGQVAGPGLQADGWFDLEDEQAYALSAVLDRFPLHALLYPEAADGTPVDLELDGELALSGAFGDVPTPVDIDFTQGQLRMEWDRHHIESTQPFSYRQDGTAFRLHDFELAGGKTRINLGGQRTASGSVIFAGGGTVDLDLLRAFEDSIVTARGVAEVNLSVTGARGQIEPVVDLVLRQARIQTDWLPQAFEEVDASLKLRPELIAIQHAGGRLGGGSWLLEGELGATGWVPDRVGLDFTVEDARVEALDFLPRSAGDAQLRLDGPIDDLLLSGDVQIEDMTFTRRIDWEEWVLAVSGDHLEDAIGEERADLFTLDVDVTADETIRIRNNVGDFVASADLELMGDSRRPGMVGVVRAIPGGEAYLKERQFDVVRGELRFIEPYAFDPELDIALQTEISAREEDYVIDYLVLGPYSDWRTQASASPGLPDADINALLLFGMTREELDRYGLEGALAVETADLIASSLGVTEAVARLGQGIFGVGGETLFRVERLDLVSGIDAHGNGSFNSELRVLAEVDLLWWRGTTVHLEQNPFRVSDTYLAFEKRFAQNLFASTYWAREQEERYLAIGGAYGLDVGVRWELQ